MFQEHIHNIGLITYQTNHLKTEQVFEKLIQNYPDFKYTFYALPFVERPPRKVFFAHRPNQSNGMNTRDLADKYACDYVICKDDTDIPDTEDMYLILGAGILSKKCVENKKILNIHPGIIPSSRGLDAFKWAIYEKKPVGNTLHFIDAKVDAGEIVAVVKTPIYANDTLEIFAKRHYDKEIDIMANFIKYLRYPINECKNATISESKRRMPYETEKELPKKFEELRNISQYASYNATSIKTSQENRFEGKTDMTAATFTLPGGGVISPLLKTAKQAKRRFFRVQKRTTASQI